MGYRLIRMLQKSYKAVNSMEARGSEVCIQLASGISLHTNICYNSKYPNGYLDIYTTPALRVQKAPTLIFVHGGGFAWGDKQEGDPNGTGRGFGWFFREFIQAGYQIVSVNYAFAPEYPYPTPIIQLGEAVRFLKSHETTYGLNMSCVVFGGTSAGGQIIGQFANIQTNEAYAKEMNIEPVLEKSAIKAMIFHSALLDMERFGKTGFFITNYLFAKCGYAYFNRDQLVGNPLVIQSNVIAHVTKDFPPSFISDANTASFWDQAKELHVKLKSYGIPSQFHFYPTSEATLSHGYECDASKYAKENLRMTIDFINTHAANKAIV